MRNTLLVLFLGVFAFDLQAQDRASSFSVHDSPVKFEPGLSELGLFTGLSNKAFKPSVPPPYPAVVIGHTCGGVGNSHIRSHARELLAAGFAVVTTDSYGPRGIQSCRGQNVVDTRHQAIDAYAAIRHLRSIPEIDANRIYYVGYSAGGIAAAQLASPVFAPDKPALRFKAIVSNYASCIFQWGPNTHRSVLLQRDADTPILMLMAEEDMELRVSDCFPQLEEMKAEGRPVEWHVYKNTSHAWDQSNGNYSVTNGFGQTTYYRHNPAATADANSRMIDFFNRHN